MNKAKIPMIVIIIIILPIAVVISLVMDIIPKPITNFTITMVGIAEGFAITVFFAVKSKENRIAKGEGK